MENNNFTQLCVWPGCLVGNNKKQKKFTEFMKTEFNTRVIYSEEVKTLAGEGGEGGRNDLFFYVHDEDIPHFAIQRLAYSISWWEDIKGSRAIIYPSEIRNKYRKTW